MRYASIIIILILISCKDDDALTPKSELLKNIEFESGGLDPDDWLPVDPFESNLFTFEWTDEQALSGDKSLKISANQSNNNDFGYWSSAITFNIEDYIGEELELSVWIKGNLQGEGAAIILRGDNESETEFVSFISSFEDQPLTGEFDWTQFRVTDFIETGIDSFSVFLVLANGTTGEVFFDNVSLRKK